MIAGAFDAQIPNKWRCDLSMSHTAILLTGCNIVVIGTAPKNKVSLTENIVNHSRWENQDIQASSSVFELE